MIRLLISLILLFSANGCQRNTTASIGGSSGVLRMGETPLADFQINVFHSSEGKLVGTGATNWEGRFQLVNPEKTGPCWLEPGEYVCVLESFGTDSPKLSPNYGDKTKSPLKIKQTDRQQMLELNIPKK